MNQSSRYVVMDLKEQQPVVGGEPTLVADRVSRPNSIIVPPAEMGLVMQLVFTPLIFNPIDKKRRPL